jgi:hypothetical protein
MGLLDSMLDAALSGGVPDLDQPGASVQEMLPRVSG